MTHIITLIRESFDVRRKEKGMFIEGDYEGRPSHIG